MSVIENEALVAMMERAAKAAYDRALAQPYHPSHGKCAAYEDVPDPRPGKPCDRFADAAWNIKLNAREAARTVVADMLGVSRGEVPDLVSPMLVRGVVLAPCPS